ncbi:MAG: hypothetical protein AAGB29_12625 [Planctomycetota bacterium]
MAYFLKDRPCPCDCDQNGVLAVVCCPECGKLILVCDEIGNAFDNLQDPLDSLPLVIWGGTGQKCPTCGSVLLSDFPCADLQALLDGGLSLDEVEDGGKQLAATIRTHQRN